MERDQKPVAPLLLRALDKVLDASIGELSRPLPETAEAIHQARKRFKEARAYVRLAAALPLLGSVEDQVLRDAGRRLSAVRDATALLECVSETRSDLQAQLGKTAATAIERALRMRARGALKSAVSSGVTREVLEEVRQARLRIALWPLPERGAATVSAGFIETYRRTRELWLAARRDPTARNLHAWRKELKRWWHQVQLLQKVLKLPLHAEERSLRRLSGLLGSHHDLEMLRQFAGEAYAAKPKLVAAVERFALSGQGRLAGNALALGELLFARRPSEVEQWLDWRAAP